MGRQSSSHSRTLSTPLPSLGLPAMYDSDALDISNIESENNRESAEVNIELIQAETFDPCLRIQET